MTAIAFFVHRWLVPDVPTKLQKPILGYIVVITFMVSMAIAVVIAQPDFQYLAVAATLFWMSDISVARARFKQADFFNKVWGIPFYFGAQLCSRSPWFTAYKCNLDSYSSMIEE